MVVGADLVGDRWPGVRARRASGAVVALLVAAAAGGCARQADPADVVAGAVEFEASPTFLRAATDRSADLSYRMEATLAMRMSAGGQSIDVEAPIMTGQQVGGRSSFHVDTGRLMVEMMDDVPGGGPSGAAEDLVADVVV
ncbi:MAG TPA: hypothetical protein VF743_00530, partial [Acidimicrobiales bacterium]